MGTNMISSDRVGGGRHVWASVVLIVLIACWPVIAVFGFPENSMIIWSLALTLVGILGWLLHVRAWPSKKWYAAVLLWVLSWACLGPHVLGTLYEIEAHRRQAAIEVLGYHGIRTYRAASWRIESETPLLDDATLRRCIPMIRKIRPTSVDLRTSSVTVRGLLALEAIPNLTHLYVSNLTSEEARLVQEETRIPHVVVCARNDEE